MRSGKRVIYINNERVSNELINNNIIGGYDHFIATFWELIIRNRLHGLQICLIIGDKIFKKMETKLKNEIEKIVSDSSIYKISLFTFLIHD